MVYFKRNYYFNDKKVGRNNFYNNLRNFSQSKVRSYSIGDLGNVDVYDFDKKKFNNYRRRLNGYNGYAPRVLIFTDVNKRTGESVNTGRFKIEKIRYYK